MRKKIFAIAIAMICLAVLTSTTLAYFTASDVAQNVITSGGIAIKVVEQQLVNGALQPYPSQPIQIEPGTTVSKIVSVANLEQPAWIRMCYTITVLDRDDKEMAVSEEELSSVISIEPDAHNWTMKDGWWYYSGAVASGEATGPLFTQVHFSGPKMGNKYQECSIIINVTAQAVQAANNGITALDAAGWSTKE